MTHRPQSPAFCRCPVSVCEETRPPDFPRGVGSRRSGQSGLQQPLDHKIRITAVGGSRMIVVADRQTEVTFAYLPGSDHLVLPGAKQFDH